MLQRLGETTFLADLGQSSPNSLPHVKGSFLFGFLWFLAVSLAVFFRCVVVWCRLPRTFPQYPEMRLMLSHVHVSTTN